MLKYIKVLPFFLLITFVSINIYLFVFNWELLSTELRLDVGLSELETRPFIAQFILGLTVILIFWIYLFAKDMRHQLYRTKMDAILRDREKDLKIAELDKRLNSDYSQKRELENS